LCHGFKLRRQDGVHVGGVSPNRRKFRHLSISSLRQSSLSGW
jgi:hypothetical protein